MGIDILAIDSLHCMEFFSCLLLLTSTLCCKKNLKNVRKMHCENLKNVRKCSLEKLKNVRN